MSLENIIKSYIAERGPVSVAAYMDLCLNHPELGYYRRKDPLGAKGDFITAPEISQLFGEAIGIWVADAWIRLGKPEQFILCECGPGRGTLMQDVLRVLSKVSVVPEVYLIEVNPVLIEMQKVLLCHPREGGGLEKEKPDARLRGHDEIYWSNSLKGIPGSVPVVFISNEFLDALPFRQLAKAKDGWRERLIGVKDGRLAFGLGNIVTGVDLPDAKEGDVFEFSAARENAWSEICARLRAQRGAALTVDYGYSAPQTGNTFQAVKDHKFADVLDNPGEQDLTSHVDFAKLKLLSGGLDVNGPLTQREFLHGLGVEMRAEKLAQANPRLKDEIYSGLKRLTHRDEMGELFKAIAVYNLKADEAD